jgi:glycosyltransferase involved in cell wall biosynthesis
VVYVTAADRQALAGSAHGGKPIGPVIPICADASEQGLLNLDAEPTLVTHLGTMFWPPNVQGVLWFAREVWPHVQREVPEAHLVIIGRRPPAGVLALPSEDNSIEVLGFVEEPDPYLKRTAAFIVPLHAGAGMRVKIMDAWAWGLPVVTTTLGAEGIDVRHGVNAMVADDALSFAGATVRLLREPGLREKLRASGRSDLVERYDWRTRYREWDEVYGSL